MIPKFRAWNKEFGMSDSFPLFWREIVFNNPKDGGMSFTFHIDDIFFQDSKNKMTVMQSTGLKDKNGKEIFEGDIVASIDLGGIIERNINGAFIIRHASMSATTLFFDNRNEKVVVIGNIYENPELLKGGDANPVLSRKAGEMRKLVMK